MAMSPAERMRRHRERHRSIPAEDRRIKPLLDGASRDNHGMTTSSEYQTWQNMIRRCYDPSATRYERYGGRGITVCARWRESFRSFYEDMGPSNGRTLERIDYDGPYEAGNCKWATYLEQNRNRSDNRYLTFDGKTQLITDWSRELGIKLPTLMNRIDLRGWSIEKALTTPVGPSGGDPNSPGAVRQRAHRARKKQQQAAE